VTTSSTVARTCTGRPSRGCCSSPLLLLSLSSSASDDDGTDAAADVDEEDDDATMLLLLLLPFAVVALVTPDVMLPLATDAMEATPELACRILLPRVRVLVPPLLVLVPLVVVLMLLVALLPLLMPSAVAAVSVGANDDDASVVAAVVGRFGDAGGDPPATALSSPRTRSTSA